MKELKLFEPEQKTVKVQEFMLDYDLSTKELLTYAIIYKFSQDNKNYFINEQEIAKWTKSSIRQVQRVLYSLIKKGFILKNKQIEENKKKYIYKIVPIKKD